MRQLNNKNKKKKSWTLKRKNSNVHFYKKGYCSMSPLCCLEWGEINRTIFKVCGMPLNYQRFLPMLPRKTTCPKWKTALQWLQEAVGESLRGERSYVNPRIWHVRPHFHREHQAKHTAAKTYVGQTQKRRLFTLTHMVWRATLAFSYLSTTIS